MITIEITGPRGEGKTTAAMALTQYLQSLGFPVTFRSCCGRRERAVQAELDAGFDATRHMRLHREFTVLDLDQQ